MLIIVDSSGLAYRSLYAFGSSLSYEESQVGVLYGFLSILGGLGSNFCTDDTCKFVFAFDSRESVRREAYPDYRKARLEKKKTQIDMHMLKEMKRQVDLLRTTVLHELGFRNQFMTPGFEADDIMAIVAESAKEPVVLVTSDRDLWQCLGTQVTMWSPSTSRMYTAEQFRKEFGIEPYMWGSVLSIAGCNTDGVVGVPGVGVKKAVAYLKGELKADSAAVKAIKSNWSVVERNVSLVTLPHPALSGTGEAFPVRKDRLTEDKVREVFDKWGFKSLLSGSRWNQWAGMCHAQMSLFQNARKTIAGRAA